MWGKHGPLAVHPPYPQGILVGVVPTLIFLAYLFLSDSIVLDWVPSDA